MTQAVQNIQGANMSSYDDKIAQVNSRINELSGRTEEANPLFLHRNRRISDNCPAWGMGARRRATVEEERLFGTGICNQRRYGAFQREIKQQGYNYNNQRVTYDNIENMRELAKKFDEYRIGGMKYHNSEEDTELLKEALNSGNGISLYLANCAEDGLKNPKLPERQRYSFENLKNPTKLIKTLQSHTFNTPEANENINLLTEIALSQRSPDMAACLLEGTAKGGSTGHGVDETTAQKILIESRQMFGSEAEYKKFITDINKSYKKIFNKSLDEYVDENYQTYAQKKSAFMIAPAAALLASRCGWIGAAVVATVGGIATYMTYNTNKFGNNEKGEELKLVLDRARASSDEINMKDIGSARFGRFARR